MAMAFHFKGRCYHFLGDYQRALYDFSMALKLDNNQGADPKQIADHYSKALHSLICYLRLRGNVSSGNGLIGGSFEAL
jgi:tetratricopeptide (TPR) repeat protein